VRESRQISMEAQLAVLEGSLEASDELAAKALDSTLRGRKNRLGDFTQRV
jgi:hypothetical protein